MLKDGRFALEPLAVAGEERGANPDDATE
ncbi:hypothetical protein MP638_006944, partial [Amoeboaphelidium occidentale]